MTNAEAIKSLINAGATKETKEDIEGNTRSGWWQDTVWLAPCSKPVAAWMALNGN